MKVRALSPVEKFFAMQLVALSVFFHFLPLIFKRKISIWRFSQFCRRLLSFLYVMRRNKFQKIGKEIRLELYVPSFPTKAFYRACEKFLEFDNKMPAVTALISITKACKFKCEHCYQKLDMGRDADIGKLVETVTKLQEKGITFFNIEGGEPFITFDRLFEVCKAVGSDAEIWVNSTGDGITRERLQKLKETPVKAIMFSLRASTPEKINELMGREDAWECMVNAIKLCHEEEIAVATNSCLEKEDFYNGNFEKVLRQARDFDAMIMQIIHPKPAGGWLECGAEIFSKDDVEHIKHKVHQYNQRWKYRSFPAISAQVVEESKEQFGCTAGGTDRFYINAKGDLQPCEFLNISFGNIHTDDFDAIYDKMRAVFETPRTCWVCERYSKDIFDIYKKEKLDTLPLSPELSKKIYEEWDAGDHTPAYKKWERMK